jgi:hypothetical protein
VKNEVMLDDVLTQDEEREASLVLEKYRQKYMCGMGPVISNLVKKALESDKGKADFSQITENFLNSAYFNRLDNKGLPQATRDILGFEIWQLPCTLEHVRSIGMDTFLTGFINGTVQLRNIPHSLEKNLENNIFFTSMKNDCGEEILSYKYSVEGVFSNMEQSFMFIRAFWYFIEAKILQYVFNDVLAPQVFDLLASYANTRQTLVLPFIHDSFPENHYYTKVNARNKNELDHFYNKYMFSKIRMVQRKSIMIAQVINVATKK